MTHCRRPLQFKIFFSIILLQRFSHLNHHLACLGHSKLNRYRVFKNLKRTSCRISKFLRFFRRFIESRIVIFLFSQEFLTSLKSGTFSNKSKHSASYPSSNRIGFTFMMKHLIASYQKVLFFNHFSFFSLQSFFYRENYLRFKKRNGKLKTDLKGDLNTKSKSIRGRLKAVNKDFVKLNFSFSSLSGM